MNTLKIYPKKIREMYHKDIEKSGDKKTPEERHNIIILTSIIITILASTIFYFFKISQLYSPLVLVLVNVFFYFKISLQASSRIKKMERIFPDVISLMSSNLRSGITIDKSFLLAARPEFTPLDEEIMKIGKEIATGKDVILSFKLMADRIGSEKISKVVYLIISGLRAGGNVADLLEETSRNMKEKETLGKKAASSILMYTIFIFFAVGIGAPILFGLSSVLVEIIITLTERLPDAAANQVSLPLTFNKVSISPTFVITFSLFFILISDLISVLVIGLVNQGEGKAGLKLYIPLLILSIGIFFGVRILLSEMLVNLVKIT